MNCPSRTDDIERTPGWNQNPPFLAADLTTCEDLNGIVNAREIRRGSRILSHLSGNITFEPPPSGFREWFWWLFSVFCTSLLISKTISFDILARPAFFQSLAKETSKQPKAWLAKRSSCSTGGVSKADYDMPLHVAALFIIFFVSTTGCAFPMLVLKFPKLRIPASFLFSARHFGTGVLIATAFVHLLPTAFIALGNPCLSTFWTSDYPAMPGAIALAAIFFLTTIEMVFSPGRNMCGGSHNMGAVARIPTANHETSIIKHGGDETANKATRPPLSTVVEGSSPLRDLGPLYGRSSSFSRTLARMGEEGEQVNQINETRVPYQESKGTRDEAINEFEDPHEHNVISPDHAHKRAVMQCMLLEIGILFHSVFIGMSLSVSIGSEFIVLLIAIIFHQTFEGLALGARIASLKWPENAIQPWVMAFAYGCTTPLGQAIGLATHTLYNPDSEVGLLLVGIMNAISSGLLVFASLVELMSEDFLSDESWRILRGKRRVYACFLVFLGAFLMALVGAWA